MDNRVRHDLNELFQSHYAELFDLLEPNSVSNCRLNRSPSLESLSHCRSSCEGGSQISGGIKKSRSLSKAERFKKMKARSSKKSKVHSRYCHLCSRPAWRIPVVECSEIHNSGCCKVVCESCFDSYGWDFQFAIENKSQYKCSHCTNQCSTTARCATYMKSNSKRQKTIQENKNENKILSEIKENSEFNFDLILDLMVESNCC
uniref:Zinc-finger domain-containing protein n=1 Tax=Timspurckia oligopyrenoides TaxID=708627 RepID=A0A7S0ZLM6_9RHOD|mmetsp:Transcript_9899/g.17841  ORF Transcript_9899/g.17841 Transcript_9899/m.17841 type:complete len:203 (+) Transcript_9899:591-1199(+)